MYLFGWTAYLLFQVVNGINMFLLKKKKGTKSSPKKEQKNESGLVQAIPGSQLPTAS
jgi:hypothetical protein